MTLYPNCPTLFDALQVALLHCYHDPGLMMPEMTVVTAAQTDRDYAELTAGMQALARRLPDPAEVVVSALPLADAVAEAVQQYQPLLLAMGLSQESDFLDKLLGNQVLPVLRATHYPLLLVPEAAPVPIVPRRVVLALDVEPFHLSAAGQRLGPLLAGWQAAYTVTHVMDGQEPVSPPPRMDLAAVRARGVLPPNALLRLHQELAATAADGILQAQMDNQADLIALIIRPRSFLGRRFHHSVTADVLRSSPVPVLLVPADASDLPD